MPKTMKEYLEMVKGKRCLFCGEPLPDKILHYDHDGGWDVLGFDKRQWLFIECDKCHYQWALWKLGVPRDG